MDLLLHACCGPCSLEPTRIYSEEGHHITLMYSNPNIHPREEYLHRLETLKSWAATQGYEVIEGEYDPDMWEQRAGCFGWDREKRCSACYATRFEPVAKYAREHGFEAIGSTLTVSPYQFTDEIGRQLKAAAEKEGVEMIFRDFRENYPEATRRSRELGMYRQNFCGCHFSDVEAAREREERKAARKAAKEAKRLARQKALEGTF